MIWLFFAMAGVCCAMIATGTVLWGNKRRIKHVKAFAAGGLTRTGAFAAFGVDVMNVGVIAGLCTAISAYFIANRLIPAGISGRADAEVAVFFLSWLGCACVAIAFLLVSHRRFASADGARTAVRRLWGWQWLLVAGLAAAIIPLDEITTRGISRAVARGDGIVLSFHASLFAAALGMFWIARMALRPLVATQRRQP